MNKLLGYKFILLILFVGLTVSSASAHSYSMTRINDYTNADDLNLEPECARVNYWLGTVAVWSQDFYETETDVEETDFGSSNSGYTGLDSADFHYHTGHGTDEIGYTSEICLYNWVSYSSTGDVQASEVEKKWDQDNEWVLIASCKVLKDHSEWAKALKYSHGILGFSTEVPVSTALVDSFFDETINENDEICDAWLFATVETFDTSVTAVIVADTDDQFAYDHLNGQGTVEPDESPDDSLYAYNSWEC
ncbi:hypothetical protein MSSAC_3094 [Methanosarcina siciliae C2J]|uniref:Uncharacterized protein n=1 Tax=Methanosarcina siciliae C2J TaxID=1434118 RepID=A0A0E3PS90_9EURY|nr:DUF6345 domain-containing protein [Methanosarcina siciliae]AKB37684.1 hypothetical protein MSSAC_3094 [Methanosarcina siciliae C2J]